MQLKLVFGSNFWMGKSIENCRKLLYANLILRGGV